MVKNSLVEFAFSHPLTMENLKAFCRMVILQYETEYVQRLRVKLTFLAVPKMANASVWIGNRRETAVIRCNLWNARFSGASVPTVYFQICASLLHELEHLRIYEQLHFAEAALPDQVLIELLADRTDRWLPRILHRLVCWFLPGLSERSYASSSEELQCMQKSHLRAAEIFAPHMDGADWQALRQRCEAISIMEQSCEVYYYLSRTPQYKMAVNLVRLQYAIHTKPLLLETYPMLQDLFMADGLLVSLEQLWEKSAGDTGEVYQALLLWSFLEGQKGLLQMLQEEPDRFQQMEAWCNAYCGRCIRYIQNKPLLKQWFHSCVVEDNGAMMLKNLTRLRAQMEKLHMKNTTGMVFPMYHV